MIKDYYEELISSQYLLSTFIDIQAGRITKFVFYMFLEIQDKKKVINIIMHLGVINHLHIYQGLIQVRKRKTAGWLD